MIKHRNSFHAINTNSKNAKVKDIVFSLSNKFINNCNEEFLKKDYLCICSGSTTSGCAKDDLITIDLRKNYNQISYDEFTGIARIGGGVVMGDLLKYLEKFNKMFPVGLSHLPGAGYILTGGISPLSRRYGLAIDNIVSAKGFFGNGNSFSLNIESLKEKEIKAWEGIKGAAPFFAIVTELGLQTFKTFPIKVFEGFVSKKELEELISLAENFPENFSFQWIFSEYIYIYIVAELKSEIDQNLAEKYIKNFLSYSSLKIKEYKNFNQICFFPKELNLFELNSNYHSEVISLLGKDIGKNKSQLIQILTEINSSKPNNSCYVAAQQLGEKTSKEGKYSSFFIHRECSWKPWIFAAWEKNNSEDKRKAIYWMNQSWDQLKGLFPHIHLAQLHNHLNSHDEEINLAFGNKLKNLNLLKNLYDPRSILPPL